MRRIGWLLLVLVALGWLAEQWASEPNASPPDTTAGWRRTNCGWQRVESLGPPPQSERPTLHPAIVGGLEILLTLTALVAFSSGESAREASCETPRNPSGGTRSVPDTLP